MIWSRKDDGSTRLEKSKAVAKEPSWIVEVFDDLCGDDDIDRAYIAQEVRIKSLAISEKEVDIRETLPGNGDTRRGQIRSVKLPPPSAKKADESTIATASVHNDGPGGDTVEKVRHGWV